MRFPQGVHFNNNKVVSHAILVAILIFYFLIFLKLYLNYISIQDNNCKLYVTNVFNLTVQKMSQYGVFSGPYFPVFGLNTGKYEPEKAPNLDLFHVVANVSIKCIK